MQDWCGVRNERTGTTQTTFWESSFALYVQTRTVHNLVLSNNSTSANLPKAKHTKVFFTKCMYRDVH